MMPAAHATVSTAATIRPRRPGRAFGMKITAQSIMARHTARLNHSPFLRRK